MKFCNLIWKISIPQFILLGIIALLSYNKSSTLFIISIILLASEFAELIIALIGDQKKEKK